MCKRIIKTMQKKKSKVQFTNTKEILIKLQYLCISNSPFSRGLLMQIHKRYSDAEFNVITEVMEVECLSPKS